MALREKAGYFIPQATLDFALGRKTAGSDRIIADIHSSLRPAPRKTDEAAKARMLAKRAARLAC